MFITVFTKSTPLLPVLSKINTPHHAATIFSGQPIHEAFFFACYTLQDEGNIILKNVGKPIIQRQNVGSQKNSITSSHQI
jgi:hypothetical protein